MAFARGRQAAEETSKAECLRRWPHLMLQCRAVYHLQNHRIEGYVITKDDLSYGGRLTVGTGRSAPEAWRDCLVKLDED